MNTKYLKYFSLLITLSFFASLLGYLLLDQGSGRKIASDVLKNQELTSGQNQKWSITEQFNLRQTSESLLVNIPHLVDLCAENQNIVFKFSAYEVFVASENPHILFSLNCSVALSAQKAQFEILYSDLILLQTDHEKNFKNYNLNSKNIFADEPLPLRWNLSEISIEGFAGFKINQFEIQKVFGHNFEFELLK